MRLKPPLEVLSGENFLDRVREHNNEEVSWFLVSIAGQGGVAGVSEVYINYSSGLVLSRGDVINVIMFERNSSSIVINTLNAQAEWSGWKRITPTPA